MELKEKEKNSNKENIQINESEIHAITDTKLEQSSSSNLLNNPSDFIISQNPLEDLKESNSAIIHIKNTCKNSCCNCYVNCCCGHSITFNTFVNTQKNRKYLFQNSALIKRGFRCIFQRNAELQATFSTITKSTPEEISSNEGTPYALMDKPDAFCCCNYKDDISMAIKIIPENRIAGTIALKSLKDKCPCPGCECLLNYFCLPFFPFIPCLSDCCPDCSPNPKSNNNSCCSNEPNRCCCGCDCNKCCSNDPNRCCCGCDCNKCCSNDPNKCCCGMCSCPKCDFCCGCDCNKCCSDVPNRCCYGLCQRPNCCCCDPNRCCCGICPKPNCDCCGENRSCCGLCPKSNSFCCCCCCCGNDNNSSSGPCCKTFDYYCTICDSSNVLKYYVLYDYKCKCGCKCLRRKMGLNFIIYDKNKNKVATIRGINDNKNIGMFFDDSYSYLIDFPSDATPDDKLALLHCIYSLDILCLY